MSSRTSSLLPTAALLIAALPTVALLIGGTIDPLHAQTDDVSEQLWVDYNLVTALSPGTDLRTMASVRTELGNQRWFRLIVRPEIRRLVGRVWVVGGLGNFYTQNDEVTDLYELRPYFGAAVVWPQRGSFRLQHYARIEERLSWQIDDGTLRNSTMLRYRLRAEYDLSRYLDRPSWRLLASVEGFATPTDGTRQFNERGRIGIGAERRSPSGLRLRVEATWQKTGRLFTGAPTTDLLLRLRVFHR
jgi:Protein of unknown function (DUF2490)